MIKITNDMSQAYHKLTVTGHAEYAPAGQDIVCAAVSALVCTLADVLDDYGADLYKDGDDVTLECWPCDNFSCAAWDTINRGLFLVAENYPDNVTYDEVT